MAAPRYHTLINGVRRLIAAIQTSAGAGDADKIVATNASGRLDDTLLNAAITGNSVVVKTLGDGTLDPSIMPAGIGADVKVVPASETLAANDLVNLWDDAGTVKARKADATTNGKPVHGYVKAGAAAAANASVYFEGRMTGLAGLTVGAPQFLGKTAGLMTADVSTYVSGNVVQEIGVAVSATELDFEKQPTIEIA